ncbi:MAG: hypothetical protein ACP5U1_06160 [Desulfomonilaceae bacterium]
MNQPSYQIGDTIMIPHRSQEAEIIDVYETPDHDWEYTLISSDGAKLTLYESELSCQFSGRESKGITS